MTDFRDVLALEALPEGRVMTVRVDGHVIGLARIADTAHAFQSLCPHDKASLQDGKVDGCQVHCPRHFARFDLKSGKVSAGWRVDDLRLYPVRLRDGRIEVDADALRRQPPEGPKKVWDFT
ncbi:Rieske (2Fe-2S) protein [Mangrovicoccus algicola]|uniref:Rieske 2Fe-2S domain-containing protein n=1 Tax=Mangrovicoccus algicola TaxID=2771008 RepID=A0A8J7CX19_9RHOB|nr:Rieske 2Fe-2S domain-containing protein [Mangrovicoccus algicola]MBE3640064.1 Rieske 2Fe-2S domain-containing protein [Mangrovicoccus algicola]